MTNSELGANIRMIRELKGITQQNLADELKVNQKTISRIENGSLSPKFDVLVKISDVLAVSLENILQFDDKQIFNNYSQNQQGGKFIAYNNTAIDQVEELYHQLLAEKDKRIALLEKNTK